MSSLRQIAVKYAWTLLHVPYRWGGDDPMSGFDCSGGVQEILASVGKDPKGDQTADDLMRYFGDREIDPIICGIPEGCLVFFGNSHKAAHVGFSIGDGLMFEFGGGGSSTLTEQDSINQNAFGRIRPISRRSDLICVCDPF